MTFRHVLCVSGLVAGVLLPTVAFAEPPCDASSLSGGYGFHLTGTNLARSALYAIVGRIEVDGQGGFVGSATHSAQGSVSRAKFTGTYTVNPDCTGTSTMKFENGSTATLDFVLTGDLNEFYIIDAGQGTVESGSGRRQFRLPARTQATKDGGRR
jgi:hypothetical protein